MALELEGSSFGTEGQKKHEKHGKNKLDGFEQTVSKNIDVENVAGKSSKTSEEHYREILIALKKA